MYEGAIQDLIDALGRLPGIGPKSAQRIAFHILQSENETAQALVDAIRTVKERCVIPALPGP
jgi:recombination protein RecR